MKIIHSPRGEGKTLEAIKISEETGAYIVCLNQKHAESIKKRSVEMGLNIPYPLTFDELLRGEFYGRGIKSFVIDDADMLLQSLTRGTKIEAVTFNKEF